MYPRGTCFYSELRALTKLLGLPSGAWGSRHMVCSLSPGLTPYIFVSSLPLFRISYCMSDNMPKRVLLFVCAKIRTFLMAYRRRTSISFQIRRTCVRVFVRVRNNGRLLSWLFCFSKWVKPKIEFRNFFFNFCLLFLANSVFGRTTKDYFESS